MSNFRPSSFYLRTKYNVGRIFRCLTLSRPAIRLPVPFGKVFTYALLFLNSARKKYTRTALYINTHILRHIEIATEVTGEMFFRVCESDRNESEQEGVCCARSD